MSWRRFVQRANWDRERSAEIESYLQIETDANLARGMPPDEARSAARRKLGNSILVREEIYSMNTVAWWDAMAREVRYALRTFRHNPLFTALAVLTIALGIGANTAVFSVVNSVLLKPLPYPNAGQLVAVRQFAPGAAGLANISDGLRLSPSMYFTYAEHNRTLQALGVWLTLAANVTGLSEPEQVRLLLLSDGALQALGVPPALGRWLHAADQAPGAPQVVLLSYGYWQRHFGADPSVLGRKLVVDSSPRTIAGVMPPKFRFVTTDFDLIVPMGFDRSKLSLPGFGFPGIARLKPGVTIAQADADLARLLPVWMHSWPFGGNPQIYETWRITPALLPLQQDVTGGVSGALWTVMATIGLVILIACANVTNLLLVRAESRRQELAIRAAIGAGRSRIVRGLLVESVLLGLMGGAVGIVLAWGGLRLLLAIGPANLPRLDEISLDARAIGVAFALSVLSGLLFGALPALKYAGPRISAALGSASRGASASRDRHRTRNLLVVAQVAMALVLLISAGLMIRSFQQLRSVPPGFMQPRELQTIRISIPNALVSEPKRVTRMQNDILDKLSAIPGVRSAAFTSAMPLEGIPPNWDDIQAEGKNYARGEIAPLRLFKYVSPGFFRTAGAAILAGRDLTWDDVYGLRRAALISENLAREFWGSPAAAVGKRFHSGPGAPWWEVIGVVQDVRENGVDENAPTIVYWPPLLDNLYGPGPVDAVRSMTFAIRSARTGSEGFLQQIRQAVWSTNASLPVAAARSMQEIYDRSLVRTSFTLAMLGIAAAMALALGIVGIYGVISYAVSQQRREIGIRLALGAQPAELQRLFLGHALKLAAAGVAIGMGAAAVLTRLMKALLFGVSPLDPLTYVAVPLVLSAAAVLASYLPARRAAAIDPLEALKVQ